MSKFELTSEELDLLTTALSDSMNYNPDDRFNEKWALLLALTRKKMKLKERERTKVVCEDHGRLWDVVPSLLALGALGSVFLFLIIVAFR